MTQLLVSLRRLVLALALAASVSGCFGVGTLLIMSAAGQHAPTSTAAALPPTVTLISPAPEIDQKFAAFAGMWRTEIRSSSGLTSREHILVVEEIRSPGQVVAVFSIGAIGRNPLGLAWGEPQSERVEAHFENGDLVFSSGNWRATYSMEVDGLRAELSHPATILGRMNYGGILRCVQIAATAADRRPRSAPPGCPS
jgi:hypothetical protein